MKNVLMLTPVYPGVDVHQSTTPVVHYFVREWVKLGYNVKVIHFPVNFPQIVYTIAKPFKDKISTIMGSEIRTWAVKEIEYDWENVHVKRIPMTKYRPHSRYSSKQIRYAVEKTISYCDRAAFIPDVIIAHWVNPTLEIMHHLKAYYSVRTCFVAHDTGRDLDSIYKKEALLYLKETDVIGYRSGYIKRCFEEKYKCIDKKTFMCYSGIPAAFFSKRYKLILNPKNFIFVGMLIKRKFPALIISAVYNCYANEDFDINYIGYGEEKKKILKLSKKMRIEDKVHLLGYMPRDKVVEKLEDSDVFVMISKNETFGLVYLEAMARGCITIASKREGFDGIIENGKNGFLCEAGNVDELTQIIMKIRNMRHEELNMISKNAIETAEKLTDKNVAVNYIKSVFR